MGGSDNLKKLRSACDHLLPKSVDTVAATATTADHASHATIYCSCNAVIAFASTIADSLVRLCQSRRRHGGPKKQPLRTKMI
jgi:hypothetical protein